jgi:hypothetical protein
MNASPEDASTRCAGHPAPEPLAEFITAAPAIASALNAVQPSSTRRRRNVPGTAERLCHRHGEAKARKIARREQREARQKRSRTNFAFWAAVAVELEKHPQVEIRQEQV